MSKKEKIRIHRMDDWFSGIYLKSFGAVKTPVPDYEISRPHRHDFYYCVLLDKGEMELEVDFKKIEITGQSLFLSYPGQIHSILSARMERGWFLAFDPSLPDGQLKNILDQCLSEIILVPLTSGQTTSFYVYLDHLYAVYRDEALLFRKTVIQAMVTAFIYQLASAYLSMERFSLMGYSARSIEITKTFRQILRHNFKAVKSPSEYAAKMNITTSYLNDTVRLVTGFPVTWYIQQELVREAQRLLYYSDLTVKEIAGTLGFEDANYFNRLFSKVAGVSPGRFQKKWYRISAIINLLIYLKVTMLQKKPEYAIFYKVLYKVTLNNSDSLALCINLAPCLKTHAMSKNKSKTVSPEELKDAASGSSNPDMIKMYLKNKI